MSFFYLVVSFVRLLPKSTFALEVKQLLLISSSCSSSEKNRARLHDYVTPVYICCTSNLNLFFPLPPHHISHCTSLFNYLPFQSQHLQVSSMLLNFHQYYCSLSSLHLSSHHGNLTSDSKELCKTWHAVFPLIRY